MLQGGGGGDTAACTVLSVGVYDDDSLHSPHCRRGYRARKVRRSLQVVLLKLDLCR